MALSNPGERIFKGTANDSPSPWGEGRVEGVRDSNLLNRRQRRPRHGIRKIKLKKRKVPLETEDAFYALKALRK
jgi:hypothetical protein